MPSIRERFFGAYEAIKKGIFIISTFLISFIAVRNSMIWHMEQFWGASKIFFQEKWLYIYGLLGEDDFLMYTVGTGLLGFVVYAVANSFFAFVDLTGLPHQLHKYKIQETKNVPVNWEKYTKCFKVIAFNSFFVGPSFLLISWPFARWRGLRIGPDLPSFTQAIIHIIFYVIIEEIGFYYIHRLFHHRYFYSRIHKIHHEWTAPVSISSIYCHPIEHFFCNTLPIMAGPLLLGDWLGNHLASGWLWITLAVVNTTFSHCGYHLPFLVSPEAHDFHHNKFNQNFGVLGILDRLHGTDEAFRRSRDYERHIVLTGLQSAKEIVPDIEKKATPVDQ